MFQLRENPAYTPDLHIDVYGTLGIISGGQAGRMADYLAHLEEAAAGLQLYVEGPMDMGGKDAQIGALKALKKALKDRHCGVKIVADEWCNTYEDIRDFTDAECCHMVQIKTPDLGSLHNTIESILYCRDHGMEAYQGGSCNETDISARTCVHAALAARPARMLVKPVMGFDEGFTVVRNEMERTRAVLEWNERQ